MHQFPLTCPPLSPHDAGGYLPPACFSCPVPPRLPSLDRAASGSVPLRHEGKVGLFSCDFPLVQGDSGSSGSFLLMLCLYRQVGPSEIRVPILHRKLIRDTLYVPSGRREVRCGEKKVSFDVLETLEYPRIGHTTASSSINKSTVDPSGPLLFLHNQHSLLAGPFFSDLAYFLSTLPLQRFKVNPSLFFFFQKQPFTTPTRHHEGSIYRCSWPVPRHEGHRPVNHLQWIRIRHLLL